MLLGLLWPDGGGRIVYFLFYSLLLWSCCHFGREAHYISLRLSYETLHFHLPNLCKTIFFLFSLAYRDL